MEQFLGLPPIASEHGYAVDTLLSIIHILMFIIFFGWITFYGYTIIRFRKSAHPKANYFGAKGKAVIYLSLAIAVIEISLDMAYSVPAWNKRIEQFPPENNATVIRVVAEQFAWNFHYPGRDGIFGATSIELISPDNPLGLDRSDNAAKDDIVTLNQLNVPVDKPVILKLSSKDVIHSFNLPLLRVKQDIIPGMNIPVWFQPVKTTAQVQKELTKTISLRQYLEQGKTIPLPVEQTLSVSDQAMDEFILTETVTDANGAIILNAGDQLNIDNIKLLNNVHINSIKGREAAHREQWIAMEELQTGDSITILSKAEPLTEDVITRAVKAGKTEIIARPASGLDNFVSMQNYYDTSGTLIIGASDYLDDVIITALTEAGIMEISIAPATPTEITCAQLCGLGHYRMRGYLTIQTAEEYEAWMKDQESSLQPQENSTVVGEAPSDTITLDLTLPEKQKP